MAAKRAKRWGIHYEISGVFRQGLYRRQSAFTVRGRNHSEALSAALNDKRLKPFTDFIVEKVS